MAVKDGILSLLTDDLYCNFARVKNDTINQYKSKL